VPAVYTASQDPYIAKVYLGPQEVSSEEAAALSAAGYADLITTE
jgi:hypothetical protein